MHVLDMHKHLYGGIKLATCLKRLHIYLCVRAYHCHSAVCFCMNGAVLLLCGWFVAVWMVQRIVAAKGAIHTTFSPGKNLPAPKPIFEYSM